VRLTGRLREDPEEKGHFALGTRRALAASKRQIRAEPRSFPMSFNTRCLFALTTLLALSANACSTSPERVARSGAAPVQCAGGVIQTESDAARYQGCSAVAGDLRIEDSLLSDLTALDSLRTVSGALVIANNAALSTLSGLENLQSAQALEIRDNPELTSLRGLERLERVEKLDIVRDGLFETSGLARLQRVGELTIADNPKLISLRGLNALTRAGSVQIRNNRVLCAQLGFLPQLGEATEALVVSSNRSVSKREIESLREHVKVPFDSTARAGREVALH
jgi:Receptor L domain